MKSVPEKDIKKVFLIALTLKGIFSFVEVVGGILILFTGTATHWIPTLLRRELIEDPTDLIATRLQHYLPYLNNFLHFAAIYLLSHGAVKLFLIISILQKKLWAYPIYIAVIIYFIFYQIYHLGVHHSIFAILLTLFDLIMVWLTWHEYRIAKAYSSNNL